jgi:aldehyde dehydrogenase (NAD+)
LKEMTMAANSIDTHAAVKHPDRFFINGRWDTPSSASKIDVVNCVTEEVFLRVAEAREADIDRAVAAARGVRSWPVASHEPLRTVGVFEGDRAR